MGRVNRIDRPTPDSGYATDFHAWALAQATILRGLQTPGLDSENLAEEVESLGRSERHEVLSRATVLLHHLLKWQFQPERRGSSWRATIAEQRQRIAAILRDSPSLRRTVPAVMDAAYADGLELAVIETGLDAGIFPASCPWTPSLILEKGWLPDA